MGVALVYTSVIRVDVPPNKLPQLANKNAHLFSFLTCISYTEIILIGTNIKEIISAEQINAPI